MARKTLALVVGLLVLVSTVVFGASAFTSASVQRDASVNVVTDDAGLIAIQDNTSGTLVSQTDTGLSINLANESASGVNADATFTFGDSSTPLEQHTFNVTNNAGQPLALTFDYTLSGSASDGDSDPNLTFDLYDASGNHLTTFSEESSSKTVSDVADGETVYVVVTVNTKGLTTSADLSGTLSVTV
ncbi:MAG: hypothetical protein ABEJ68_03320 [Halobacteriaceae archaeon]